jgi:hypothetical protein
VEKQILATQFVNVWMKNRVPQIRHYFTNATADPIYSEIGIAKDLEILEMIFNCEAEIYNLKASKNTPEVEDRLSRIYD